VSNLQDGIFTVVQEGDTQQVTEIRAIQVNLENSMMLDDNDRSEVPILRNSRLSHGPLHIQPVFLRKHFTQDLVAAHRYPRSSLLCAVSSSVRPCLL
jgi:hypothetical protein